MAHHPWCIYWLSPEKDCKLCKRLREKFPEEDLTPDEMAEKYFPDAVIVRREGE